MTIAKFGILGVLSFGILSTVAAASASDITIQGPVRVHTGKVVFPRDGMTYKNDHNVGKHYYYVSRYDFPTGRSTDVPAVFVTLHQFA